MNETDDLFFRVRKMLDAQMEMLMAKGKHEYDEEYVWKSGIRKQFYKSFRKTYLCH